MASDIAPYVGSYLFRAFIMASMMAYITRAVKGDLTGILCWGLAWPLTAPFAFIVGVLALCENYFVWLGKLNRKDQTNDRS